MPRYVRDGEVFEIEQQGPLLLIVDAGVRSTKKFVTEEHAAVQLRRLVDQRLAAGFVELAPPRDGEPWPSPDDLEAVTIHADRLMADGDARGSLVALQLALEELAGVHGPGADARRAELEEQGAALWSRHRELCFGALGHAASVRFSTAASQPHAPASAAPAAPASLPAFGKGAVQPIRLELRLGRIDRARLVATPKLGVGAAYRALRALPNAQSLRALSVGATVTRDKRAGFHYDELYEAMEDAPPPSSLMELAIGDVTPELVPAANPSDVTRPLTLAQGLRGLSVSGRRVEFTPVALPHLTTLCLRTTIHPSLLATLGRCTLPALTRLSLVSFGIGAVLPEALDLVERHLRGVKDLTLRGFRGGGDREDLFARGLYRELTRLDMADNALGEDLGEWILSNAARFQHLEHFDLTHNHLSYRLVRELRAALPRASVLDQGGPIPVDRFEGIVE